MLRQQRVQQLVDREGRSIRRVVEHEREDRHDEQPERQRREQQREGYSACQKKQVVVSAVVINAPQVIGYGSAK